VLKVVEENVEDETPSLEALAREGARRMLTTALEAEVAEYVAAYGGERDEDGRAVVVRNGRRPARTIVTGSGTIEVEAPRVNDKRVIDGARQRFTSKILPPYMRRSPKVDEVLPILYLRGLSTGDFREAIPALLGEDAAGLSSTTITRLTNQWESEHEEFQKQDLSDREYVYVWVDGIHVNVRLEDDRVCLLVIIGARPDGTKELIAVEDGYRESTESWQAMLRGLKRRGLAAPVVAVGDGALGFWAAVRDVWPETREQRCWVHRLCNVLDKLPKRLQGRARNALHEIMDAESKADAERAADAFEAEYAAKYPKAVASLRRDFEKLLTFFDFPAEHWKHLRTTNIIESPFATVRLRQRVTKGPGSRTKAITMTFKLLEMAEARWRRLNGHELLPLVAHGVKYQDGIQVENKEERAA
jgi:transposase-like protein